MKRTVVIGASLKPERTSHDAILKLKSKGHEVIAIGLKEGEVGGIKILKGKPEIRDVDTISLYIKAKRQEEMMNYLLSLHPRRIIFNPGAENPAFMAQAISRGIDAFEACTLTMLSIGAY